MLALLVTSVAIVVPPDEVDFARDVQPIFRAHCVACHGPDERRGGLRLDEREASRSAYVAGCPDESELLRRVTSSDPDERMPQKAKPLAPRDVEVLRAWIAAGARWPDGAAPRDHWSYRPLRRAAAPHLADERGVVNDVDRFVRARLADHGLAPSPEADRATLARRVSLDLTGLPPALDELDAFLADARPNAYERFVDRLLASSAYAERRAQWWLDLARYADTNGYEKDERRTAWRWRDWVIAAFDANVPFDRFTVLQLAGDLLPDATLDERIATGFHRNTLVNQEGGTDPEEFRVAAVIDRVNTTSTVWLGTTMGCVQCHDHKFDPFTQREYYALFAFFDQTKDVGNALEPTLSAPTTEQAAEDARLAQRVAELEREDARDDGSVTADERAWRDRVRAALPPEPEWTPLVPASATSDARETRLAVQDDGRVLATGDVPARETYRLDAPLPLARLGLVRIATCLDPTLPTDGPGRQTSGNFVLTDVALALVDAAGRETMLEAHDAVATYEQTYGGSFGARLAVDADPASGWAIDHGGMDTRAESIVIALDRVADVPHGATLRATLAFQSPYDRHSLGSFRLAASGGALLAGSLRVPAEIEALLRRDESSWSTDERGAMHRHWRDVESPLGHALAAARRERDAFRATIPTALVMERVSEPRVTHVLTKGSYLSPGVAVEPNVPAVLPPLPSDAARDRLALARWIVSRDNPLTPRVIVNRVWAELFGRGIVATLDDFGTRGDAPTHPELLDALALDFVASGWDVKALFRAIVTSATYRQSSDVSAVALERDPENVWLGRAPRPRLEGETLRDVALAASGLLVRTIGGPSVMPPQPDGVWAPVYSGDAWKAATDDGRFRRGLYTFWRRGSPFAMYTLFDAPSRELTCTRRARTDTPLQALAMLDDPQFVECAAGLALRMLHERDASDARRIALGFRLCTSRVPDERDVATLARLLERERRRYASSAEAAHALVTSVAAALRDERAGDERELAAWISVGNVLLALDETVTRN